MEVSQGRNKTEGRRIFQSCTTPAFSGIHDQPYSPFASPLRLPCLPCCPCRPVRNAVPGARYWHYGSKITMVSYSCSGDWPRQATVLMQPSNAPLL